MRNLFTYLSLIVGVGLGGISSADSITLYPTMDTFVQSNLPNNSFGSSTIFIVGHWPDSGAR